MGKWGDYHLYGDVYYGALTNPQITHADFSVLHNGHPSVRIDGPAIPANPAREVNNVYQSVAVNDRVYFECYIKTNPSPIGAGGIIGFDVYGTLGDRILEVHPCTPQTAIWNIVNGIPVQGGTVIYVPYGRDWTLLSFGVTIPTTLYTHDDWGNPLSRGAQQIGNMVPWLTASKAQGESASVWFADALLQRNPSVTPPVLTLPFHDNLTNLTNWQIKNGIWGIS